MSAPAKLEIKDLTIRYDGGPPVVRKVSLAVPRNSIYAFIGPAGSGKTSILRTINPVSYTHLTLPTIYSV